MQPDREGLKRVNWKRITPGRRRVSKLTLTVRVSKRGSDSLQVAGQQVPLLAGIYISITIGELNNIMYDVLLVERRVS